MKGGKRFAFGRVVWGLLLWLPCGGGVTGFAMGQVDAGPVSGSTAAQAESYWAATAELLEGREVVLRIHEAPSIGSRERSRTYETVRVAVRDLAVKPDAIKAACPHIADWAKIVAEAEDQDDPVLKFLLDHIGLRGFYGDTRVLSFRPLTSRKMVRRLPTLEFVDALGQPIGEAKVEVYSGSAPPEAQHLGKGTYRLTSQGRLESESPMWIWGTPHFIISHPDYGRAEVMPRQPVQDDEITFRTPLIHRDSVAAKWSARGRVVDADDRPVSGAMVSIAGGVVQASGKMLSHLHPLNAACQVATDATGRFSIHPFLDASEPGPDGTIPPGCVCRIKVQPPEASGLDVFSDHLPCGDESRIVLVPWAQGRSRYRFVFVDRDGPIVDSDRLQSISVFGRPTNRSFPPSTWTYSQWVDGPLLRAGTYDADGRWSGMPHLFEPVTISSKSDPDVVFRLIEKTEVYGQVIHAVTGDPIEGAVVIAGPGVKESQCAHVLASRDWPVFRALASGDGVEEHILQEMQEKYGCSHITRTDRDGAYKFDHDTRRDGFLSRVAAIKEGFMVSSTRGRGTHAQRPREVEMSHLKLVPVIADGLGRGDSGQ